MEPIPRKLSFKAKGVILLNRIIDKLPIIKFIDTTSATNFYSKFFVVLSTILVIASFGFVATHLVLVIANLGYAIYITVILIVALIALTIMIEDMPDAVLSDTAEEKDVGAKT